MQKEIEEKLANIENLINCQNIKPLTLKEASEYLDISKSYLYKLTSTNQIPHYKPNGKKIYFQKSELNQWLLRNRMASEQEIDEKANSYILRDKANNQ